jgi:glycerol uptake facilitator-like aquaporin
MSSCATKRYVAEFVGTAVLVVGGVGTAVFATSTAPLAAPASAVAAPSWRRGRTSPPQAAG